MVSYEYCLRNYGQYNNFLAFIDVDEFIVLSNTSSSIPSILKIYEEYGGLVINWMIFGSSGFIKRPPNGVSEYQYCATSCTVKSIIQPRHVLEVSGNPHWFVYRNKYAVNENYIIVNESCSHESYQKIFINHYTTKSLQDFQNKIKRGKYSNSLARGHSEMSYFYDINNQTTNICPKLDLTPKQI